MSHRHKFSWSDLPPELLESIAGHLKPNPDDLLSFRCVCKHWRSSISPPPLTLSPLLPLNIPSCPHHHPGFQDPFERFRPPSYLVSTAVYLLRPPHRPSATPWLVSVEQSSPGKLQLFHPLTRLPIKNNVRETSVPKMFTSSSAMEVSNGYNLRYCDGGMAVLERKAKLYSANKVLLWENPYQEKSSLGIKQSWLVVLFDKGTLVCLPLQGWDDYFSYIQLCSVDMCKFDDVVIQKGMVLAVNRKGRVYGFDYQTMKIADVLVHRRVDGSGNERRKRLLLDSNTDELYLIVRDYRKRTNFKVYKQNSYAWEELTSLGDRVLFVSFDTCFFVPAGDLPGFQGNCIVFPKDCFPLYYGHNTRDDYLFQKAKSSEYFEVGVYKYGESDNFQLISDCPGFSDALWPPPPWIWEDMPTSHEEFADQEEERASEHEKVESKAEERNTELCVRMGEQEHSLAEHRGTVDTLRLGIFSVEHETRTHSTEITASTSSSALSLLTEGQTTSIANYQDQVHEGDLAAEEKNMKLLDELAEVEERRMKLKYELAKVEERKMKLLDELASTETL